MLIFSNLFSNIIDWMVTLGVFLSLDHLTLSTTPMLRLRLLLWANALYQWRADLMVKGRLLVGLWRRINIMGEDG